jgi:hypothetical protein
MKFPRRLVEELVPEEVNIADFLLESQPHASPSSFMVQTLAVSIYLHSTREQHSVQKQYSLLTKDKVSLTSVLRPPFHLSSPDLHTALPHDQERMIRVTSA